VSQESVGRIRAAYAAINQGDLGPALALMAPDIEWIEPDGAPGVGGLAPGSGVFHGPEAVVEGVFKPCSGPLWGDFRVEPDDILDAGDHVVVLGHLRATEPGSGRPAETPFAHVWRMRGDTCDRWRCYEDTHVLHNARANWSIGRP
jgi:ketosteroid isomerase-like protein